MADAAEDTLLDLLEIDGRCYKVSNGWVRQILDCSSSGCRVLGPIVATTEYSRRSNLAIPPESDKRILLYDSILENLDPIGWSGEYVVEVLDAKPIQLSLLSSEQETAFSNQQQQQQQQDYFLSSPRPYERMRRELETRGFTVWEGAIPEAQINTWRALLMTSSDSFYTDTGQDESIRSDIVNFVTSKQERTMASKNVVASLECLDYLEQVVVNVTQGRCPPSPTLTPDQHLSLWRPDQGMVAQYLAARQAQYTWHLDNELTTSSGSSSTNGDEPSWRNYRTLTAIVYLNPVDWDVTRDGGGLECQILPCGSRESTVGKDVHSSSSTTIVSPVGGTIVLFDSRNIRHRVLPSYRDRLAITQWFVSPELEPAPVGWRRHQHTHKQQQQAKKRAAGIVQTTACGTVTSKRSSSSRVVQPTGDFCHVYDENNIKLACPIYNSGISKDFVGEDGRLGVDSENTNNNTTADPTFSFNFFGRDQ